ncbi:tRNA CCA-pyrophosphorylase [Francisella tularensis subsp. novicida]|uniref:CCA tRNA nucleotidyltransferase n=1 Tax=Francisella tularensis TaxID=263 RepID=UPI000CE29672|nr:CCA tRNA nucleotidyltransferase [Francisella tularensis]AVC43636.1 tRNA CCA-pyrophosphorylase [Francisella tularensis subsp. novicida]
MKFYLVGGAVRDMLLGITSKDKDWVVVGATEDEMLANGFIKIAANFPVFIHPQTKQEYALARSEKKTASGYHGFEVNFSKYITLEDDLKRRDLTINSIAIDQNNKVIDPFNGQADLQNRILRHTSIAFIEDPLRVVRLARFKAQLSNFNFSIAEETLALIKELVKTGELNHLTRERLHIEFVKALNNPKIFFTTLKELEALKIIFPNISCILPLIPNKSFFENPIYKGSNINEKITLCLLKIPQQQLDDIRKELLLTNKHYKLLKASIAISKILEDRSITAEEIFQLIKNANIIRDKNLFAESLNLYKKYLKICDTITPHRNYQLLQTTINTIKNVSIDSLAIKTIPKDKLRNTLKQLYIDIIKKQLKL